MTDGRALRRLPQAVTPDEVYNLAAQPQVRVSSGEPEYTANAVAVGTLRQLKAVRYYRTEQGRRVR